MRINVKERMKQFAQWTEQQVQRINAQKTLKQLKDLLEPIRAEMKK